MTTIEVLKTVPLFAGIIDEHKECPAFLLEGEEVCIKNGEYLVREGAPASFYVVLEGELQVLKKAGEQEMLLTTHQVGTFFGEVPLLMGTGFVASGKALGDARFFHLGEDAFWQMMSLCPSITREILGTMARRVQSLESVGQGREKLVALGTMAAGLAHELNNPAAAARRAAKELQARFHDMKGLSCRLNKVQLTGEQSETLLQFQSDLAARAEENRVLDPLEQSDREDEIATWLEDHDFSDSWKLAPTFVSANVDVAWLENVAQALPRNALPQVVEWLESSVAVDSLVREMEDSTSRISGLVQAVKSYSYMDQATVQQIDVHDGLESTLTMLGHKLRDNKIEVARDYDRSCPPLYAHGGELNQVWTNLIDNAIDAMPSGGKLNIVTKCENDKVLVEIGDSGTGIPDDVKARIFEPFFTTKDVGKGTGLGLGISHRIVANQHGGDIHIESEPGNTRFQVRLPVKMN